MCIKSYRIAGNFRGVQFSLKASLQSFRGLIFADVRTHAHYTLYNRAYFAGLTFADSCLSAKTTKIGPHENFPLYGNTVIDGHFSRLILVLELEYNCEYSMITLVDHT